MKFNKKVKPVHPQVQRFKCSSCPIDISHKHEIRHVPIFTDHHFKLIHVNKVILKVDKEQCTK